MSPTGDLPSISNTAALSSTYAGLPVGHAVLLGQNNLDENSEDLIAKMRAAQWEAKPRLQLKEKDIIPMAQGRRIIQVFIADPNENVPLEDAILYRGDQKMTDLTDQELFFEIDIKAILAAHNEKRVKLVDKKVKERTEYLEAAKVRDLKMVVNTVASF